MDYTLNCNGRLLSLKEPQVMGIMNVTPDSFYANSRQQTEEEIARRTEEILAQEAASSISEPVLHVPAVSPPVKQKRLRGFGMH